MKAATKPRKVDRRSADISIHAAREDGDFDKLFHRRILLISIHAAREGGDSGRREALRKRRIISIHAAREGGDD